MLSSNPLLKYISVVSKWMERHRHRSQPSSWETFPHLPSVGHFYPSGNRSGGGQRTYFQFKDESYNTLDLACVEKYKLKTKLISSYPVAIRSLTEVLNDINHIDLLNVDAEGLDLEVLQSYDWRVKPRVIIVEAMPGSLVSKFLDGKGYELIGLTRLNSIFLSKKG